MRLVKVEDLRKEIEIISQNHEREVDRKDAIIQVHRACNRTRHRTLPPYTHHAPRHTHCAPHAPRTTRTVHHTHRAPRTRCSTGISRTQRSSTRWRCARTCSWSTG
jgi:hypothetical protein